MTKRKILFARLASFSHTNESLFKQLAKHFPDHEIVDFDVKKAILKKPLSLLSGLIAEAMTYGPMVLADRGERHECFFKQPYTFKRTSALVREAFLPHAEEFDAVVQTQGLFNARLPNVPFILYLDYALKSPRFGRLRPPPALTELESTLYTEADALTVSSSPLKKTLVESYGSPDNKVSVIYIGSNVTAPQIEPALERYARQQIFFVGIEWERKGGPTLIEAFLKIAGKFPNAKLIIAGCAPNVSHPRINALGKISREQVAQLYWESSIFCLPSIMEPSSVAVIEAANNALPVVATQTGGFFDSVEDGVTGLLVPPGDSAALATALSRLLENPAEGMKMGLAGRARVATRFNWEIVGENLANVVRRTAKLGR